MASRSIVKHSYIRAGKDGLGKARAHVRYIRFRPGREGEERTFFNGERDDISAQEVLEALSRQPANGVLVHKVILSPGLAPDQVKDAAVCTLEGLSQQKGLDLEWYAIQHENTEHSHTHVVIMGRAVDGRAVKITRNDHEAMRESGDRLIARQQEKSLVRRGLEKLAEPMRMVLDVIAPGKAAKSEEERLPGMPEEYVRLSMSLGEILQGAKKLRKKETEKEKDEKKWKDYCRPIGVDYAKGTHLEGLTPALKLDRSMSLERLKEVASDYESGDKAVVGSVSKADYQRLKGWIEEKVSNGRKLAYSSHKVEEIKAIVFGGKETRWSQACSKEQLEHLRWMEKKGIVFLTDAERMALNRWFYYKQPNAVVKKVKAAERSQKQKASLKFAKQKFKDYAADRQRAKEQAAKRSYLQTSKEKAGEAVGLLEAADSKFQSDSVYAEEYGAELSGIAAGPMGATLGGNRSWGPAQAKQGEGAVLAMKGRMAQQSCAGASESGESQGKAGGKTVKGGKTASVSSFKPATVKVEMPNKGTSGQVKPTVVKAPVPKPTFKETSQRQIKKEIEEQILRKKQKKKEKGGPNKDPDDVDEWTR